MYCIMKKAIILKIFYNSTLVLPITEWVLFYIWGVSRQLPQRAARELQIVQFITHVYDTKMYFKTLFDKYFRRIFSSAFQWCRQFFRNFPFWPSKTLSHSISNRKHFGHSLGNILSYVKNAHLEGKKKY